MGNPVDTTFLTHQPLYVLPPFLRGCFWFRSFSFLTGAVLGEFTVGKLEVTFRRAGLQRPWDLLALRNFEDAMYLMARKKRVECFLWAGRGSSVYDVKEKRKEIFAAWEQTSGWQKKRNIIGRWILFKTGIILDQEGKVLLSCIQLHWKGWERCMHIRTKCGAKWERKNTYFSIRYLGFHV